MTSILKTTKLIYGMFIRVNGRWKYNPSADIYHWNPTDRAIRFFQKYMDYIFFKMVPNEVTTFYLERATTDKPADIAREYNDEHEVKVNAKKVSNSLYYDNRRLLEVFPDLMLYDILRNKGDMDSYESRLDYVMQKDSENSFLKSICILDLPAGFTTEKPSEADVLSFIWEIEPYIRNNIAKLMKELPMNVVGYINYVAAKKNRTAEEESFLEKIKRMNTDT